MADISDKKSQMPKSLVRASLEMGRVLADNDGITFRARGTCMYPTIRAGDVLRIQSRTAEEMCVGDIAVCRRPGYLFSHRVIGKGMEDGRTYILTRPDSSDRGGDGPTFDDHLLGAVIRIERKGKPVPLQCARHSRLMRRCFAFRASLLDSISFASIRLNGIVEKLQGKSLYRRFAGACMSLLKPRITYGVRLPVPGLGDSVFRHMSPENFETERDWRGRPVKRWTLTLHLNGAPRPAAWATFLREIGESWKVDEFSIKGLYRGAGLEDALLRQAVAIMLRSSDGAELNR